MARIYISYNRRDAEIATGIAKGLSSLGHEIVIDVESLSPGADWRRVLMEGLKSADVVVPVLSQHSLESSYVISEIGAARAFAEESKKTLIIPVIVDRIEIPPVLRDIQAIFAPERDVDDICLQIDRGINAFLGRRAAVEKEEVKVKERIESNAPEFIEEAIVSLRQVEKRHRHTGTLWYLAGFGTLIGGVSFALLSVSQVSATTADSWIQFAYLTLKAVVVIGLLAAASKYCFALGKSYVSEALKSADRLHAISFGKFYLRVFGAKASWPELKEAFQHWNIDRQSAFSGLDTAQVDPKMLEAIVEVTKAVVARQEAKK